MTTNLEFEIFSSAPLQGKEKNFTRGNYFPQFYRSIDRVENTRISSYPRFDNFFPLFLFSNASSVWRTRAGGRRESVHGFARRVSVVGIGLCPCGRETIKDYNEDLVARGPMLELRRMTSSLAETC